MAPTYAQQVVSLISSPLGLRHDVVYHDPSANLATTTPDPNLALPRKPALNTVKIARPYSVYSLAFVPAEGFSQYKNLRVCKDTGRNDLVGPEGLSRVDKGRKDLASLLALACSLCQPCAFS